MEGPSAVLALVLAETAVGSAAFVWLPRLWGRVKRGFFILVASVAASSALLATLAASGSIEPSTTTTRTAVVLLAATSALGALGLAAMIVRADTAGRVLGVASVPIGVAALVGLAAASGLGLVFPAIQLVAGAAFMGAVTDGLLLGHWYLVDRKLPRELIERFAVALLVAVGVETVAVVLLLFFGADVGEAARGLNPFLLIGGLSTWLALGMVACTALIAVLIRASLRTPRPRAVQAATGFFYLAVITAFTAEMAAKVRFLS